MSQPPARTSPHLPPYPLYAWDILRLSQFPPCPSFSTKHSWGRGGPQKRRMGHPSSPPPSSYLCVFVLRALSSPRAPADGAGPFCQSEPACGCEGGEGCVGLVICMDGRLPCPPVERRVPPAHFDDGQRPRERDRTLHCLGVKAAGIASQECSQVLVESAAATEREQEQRARASKPCRTT